MSPVVLVHILAGSAGILTGFVALYASKGAPLHRRIGLVFVWTMLVMSLTGTFIALSRWVAPAVNAPAGVLTAYLVLTGLTTLRASKGLVACTIVAFAVGATTLAFGFVALENGGRFQGMPAFPYFLFGLIGTLGAVGDVRLLRAGSRRGAARINRHLWRMATALFIAAMSFFIGQADEIPKPLRFMPLLVVPPLAALGTMLYWIWRVRIARRLVLRRVWMA
jgi:hypothetical protein